jgi:hypothetical protein
LRNKEMLMPRSTGHTIASVFRPLIALTGIGLAASLVLGRPQAATAAEPRLVIAAIGDYGSCAFNCTNEQAVANLVHGWRPDLIMTVGDNSYESGTATQVPLDQAPYAADVRAGRFYQITGNHDWGNTCSPQAIVPSTTYFGRPPHYTAHLGNGLVDLFATDMNCGDPGGDSSTSAQASWYRAEVAASTAIWKITADHQAFYSSGEHGTQRYTHWAILPSIDLFLSGHDHDFEHLIEGGQNFVVDGVGGRNLYPIGAAIPGSVWHDSTHFGGVRLTVTRTSLTVEFVNLSGLVEHVFTRTKAAESTSKPRAAAPTATTTHVPATAIAASSPVSVPGKDAPAVVDAANLPRIVRKPTRHVVDGVVLAGALALLLIVGAVLFRRLSQPKG